MDSDIQSTRLTASGAVFAGPCRIKSIWIVDSAVAGTVEIKDGGASGTTICTLDTVASATAAGQVSFPGNGLRCSTSAYVTLTDVTAVTVFYA